MSKTKMISRLYVSILFTTAVSYTIISALPSQACRFMRGKARTWPLRNHADFNTDYVTVMIVPTGVAASIGGYAGDALPSARLLSHVTDWLVTHPNVMNGATLYWPITNALYVEGYSLDAFATGTAGLRPVRKRAHKIGLLLDSGMEPILRARHIQVANAARATLGIDVAAVVFTPRPIGVSLNVSTLSGASWGSVRDTEALIEGADELLNKHRCTAIAVVARFPEDDSYYSSLFAQYRTGQGVDAIAGAEALISRVIAQKFSVPVAHAPAFLPIDEDIMDLESVAPKACAEELGYTFLPCVLAYLNRAPIIEKFDAEKSHISDSVLQAKHVDVVVTPINALGGPAVLSFLARGVLVIAVKDNHTTMEVDPAAISCDLGEIDGRIIIAESYAEAAGFIVAHKAGILLESISSSVRPVPVYCSNPDN